MGGFKKSRLIKIQNEKGIYFLFKKIVFLMFKREREREQGRGRERARDTELEVGFRLCVVSTEPDAGLNSRTVRS